MPYITVGKENSGTIDLYYEDQGSGEPVVLIHGWPLSGASWEKQVPVLLDAGYRVVTYDRRGFGRSGRPSSGYDYDTFAEDLHRVMTKLNLKNASLVGFSMGGGEVARYIGSYGSRRVKSVAFISAIPPFLLKTDDNPAGVDGAVFDGIRQAIVEDRPKFLAQFFHDFYNVDLLGNHLISDQAVQLSWTVAAGASAIATLACVSAWLTDFRDDLPAIRVPALVVHGDSDRIVPLAASGKLTHELLEDSRLVVVEGGPHGLNWTHAAQLNRALLDFLETGPAQKKPDTIRAAARGRHG
ncbi:MAG: alpha/beta hydrolase [Methanoregula sp.]|uniref:alpha/beta fold hydrolase n=1 Tax=Methanoregula sp. TaxID=2052170 RepID=UPI003D1388C0